MKANLLVVTGDELEDSIASHLADRGFFLFFARGRLKVKEIFQENKIDAIIWMFNEKEKYLADDLVAIFAEHKSVPVVIITEKVVDYLFSDKVRNAHVNIDRNDDVEDIGRVIETACNQNLENGILPAEEGVPEIEFKNAVANLISEKRQTDGEKTGSHDTLKLSYPWIAVREKEKNILSQSEKKKISLLKRLWLYWNKKL